MLVVTNQWSYVTLTLLRQQYDVVTSLSIIGKTVPPATQIHVFRVAVRLTWITLLLGDGGARIRPETLPRRKPVGGFQFSSFIKKTGNTTKGINPLKF